MNLFTQAFSLLAEPPGNLIYHLVLVFSISSALQAAFIHWRMSAFPQVRRTIIGLIILMLPQVLLFTISGLSWQGLVNPNVYLPPFDRAATLISLIWISWLWIFPEPSRPADAATLILTFFVILALTLGIATWSGQPADKAYNTSLQDALWQIASLLFLFLSILMLFIRRPNGWGNGFSVLLLAVIGHSLYIGFGRGEGYYPGIVRMANMAMYPFLITLPQRFPMPSLKSLPASAKSEAPVEPRRLYSTDPKTFHTLLGLAAETNADKISHAITRGIAQALLSDLCFLIYLTDNKNQLVIASGYDLIREENLEGASLGKTEIPMLMNAIQRGRSLRLPASSTSADMKGICDLLGLTNPGHMMVVPIITPEKDPLGGVLVLSPYSDRAWGAEDQAFLSNIATSLVPIIQRSQRVATMEQKQQETDSILSDARGKLEDLQQQNTELLRQLEALQEKSDSLSEQDEKISALLVVQNETQEQIEQLEKENEELRTANQEKGGGSAKEVDFVESELRASLEQVAHLQNDLAEANIKILQLEKGGINARNTEQSEVVASIAQELRQPMSSVVGYTDLLLGESVGLLGSLQRKFVERIKSSTQRIGSLIDDMIQVTTLEFGLMDLNPEPVDLNTIIDNAMSYTSSQIRERNISMHLDLPRELEPIYADREALQQILIHLLQNAGAATPVEGTIMLRVQTRRENNQEYVLLQVKDTGGGISSEDMPRVFTRLYRADNVLIQGVGDTGVGLSIAKTLTEAQNGRIWVESEPGVGAIFSVLLPVAKGE